ncbi:UDP-2,4-diacetamido-2,4,6-trideoxy-beta-L-altropyranose hydrolase [Vibrio ponticus]|uniref:UDP-2,4-diacetamido-2,4, 6-trideoxy-beta-L-altropyranose hydrolase n=1 Tax=Vibrio ponticus TaxID=265668 RepID=A0A3N3DUH5_9VIBR|nr:UDP-2,4-diacetamido-2,4,6-trideoxy-beta-L-altropyranose hydrolase [Vibrio ponticus]ROV58151.1 UDP-2,4-diacetamido-2,4,6-trideoxy-beta-L-altropyranose hydrolase [Vibrio ponticus]
MITVIRTDASVFIGSGHVMRCLVLARRLQEQGKKVSFACIPQQGDLIAFIEQRGFQVIRLSSVLKPLVPQKDDDYLSWLQRSVEEDVDDFLSYVTQVDLVITDHYAIGHEWQTAIQQRLKCKVVAIDDLVREHSADLIVDQTLGRKSCEYSSAAKVLAGSQYALLAPRFSQLRERAFSRKKTGNNIRVLVSMGGADLPNATLRVLTQLVDLPNLAITVLLSPRAPHYSEVRRFCCFYTHITHHDFIEDMASIMLDHDVAIGAPGTTSWERACLGLPSVIIPLADNQREISKQLVKRGAVLLINLEDLEEQSANKLEQIIADWDSFVSANLELCDGFGVERVVNEIDKLVSSHSRQLSIRKATLDDIQCVYEWQCHPETRRYALNAAVPSLEEHIAWMQNKLTCFNDYFYMVVNQDGKRLGVVRLDKQMSEEYLLSVYINPEHYGQGIASKALALVDVKHPAIVIKATVMEENIASQKLFEKAGYLRLNKENFIRPALK